MALGRERDPEPERVAPEREPALAGATAPARP